MVTPSSVVAATATATAAATACYTRIFGRVHPNWIKILKKYYVEIDSILHKIEPEHLSGTLTPPLEDIFNTFCFDPYHTKCVILGQDPYPGVGEANGFCFSTMDRPGRSIPASLRNIFKYLNTLGYTTESNNLSPWARQGVLLLNTSLTTVVSRIKEHTSLWNKLIQNILRDLAVLVTDHKIQFLLWGNDAQNLVIPDTLPWSHHIIKKFTHPSPQTAVPFKPTGHFTPDIDWSTYKEPIVIYTDGADILHGKSSYAVIVTTPSTEHRMDSRSSVDPLDGDFPTITTLLTYTGLVDGTEFQLVNDESTFFITKIFPKYDTEVAPTSQRAEYLAMSYALWIVYYLRLRNVIVVTDSHNTKNLIVEWEQHKKQKNKDLVGMMNELFDMCDKEGCPVVIEHIRSHNKESSKEKKRLYGKGNAMVDKLAGKTLKSKTDLSCYVHYTYVDLGL